MLTKSRALVTIALTIVLLAIGSPGWTQICATAPAPATPAAPMTPAAPATPVTPAPAFIGSGNTSLANGLVAYWKLDDASGTSVVDSVGSNTGTWAGTLGSQWTTGKLSGGGHFDGTTNYVNLGNVSTLAFTSSDFSACEWVYPTDNTNYRTILNKGDGAIASNSQYELLSSNFSDGKFSFDVFIGGSNNATRDPTAHATNQWYFICGTRTGSINTLYKNGIAVASATYAGTLNSTSSPVEIGAAGGTLKLAGTIDEVGIWNRALSASEVATLYNAGGGDPFGNSSCGFSY